MPSLRYLALFILLSVTLTVWPPAAFSRPLTAPADSVFGVNSHSASRYPDPSSLAVPADLLAQIGVGWAREDFQFARLNAQPDSYDWLFTDNAVNELTSRGITIIGVLNGPTPGWASGGNPANDYYPPDPQSFARFAGAVVERYKDRVRYWEVWNEPDNSRYWKPAPDAVAYANLLKATYPAIKAADPNAQVLVAGIVSPEPALTFFSTLAANGAWGSFDIVSLHPYTDPKGPEEGQIGTIGIGAVRALVDRLGVKPIWATEFGWSTGAGGRGGVAFSEEEQANYLVRGMALIRAAGAERVLWYNLKDDDGDELYGLVKRGGGGTDFSQPKNALFAFKTLNEQLAGTGSAQLLELGQRRVGYDFETTGSWDTGDQPNGSLSRSGDLRYSGSFAGRVDYNFPSGGNDFVVFLPPSPLAIPGTPNQLGFWVSGDSSGHELKVWLRDAQGEVLQFRLGPVGPPGWQFLGANISGVVEEFNVISGARNRQLDFPAQLTAIVVDDAPDGYSGAGTFYLDDLTAVSGGDAYGVRFTRGGEVVDVLWSPSGATQPINTASAQGRLVDRWGGVTTPSASNGQFTLALGPSPVYLSHQPAATVTPPPDTPPPAAPPASPPAANQRCFSETGFCIAGRIREFWEQNGGLPVFGYPITPQRVEQIEGRDLQVQWFERNRLELHPENSRPYDVLLGRLGADRLLQQGRDWQAFPQTGRQAGCRYFEQTGQSVCGDILSAWRASGLEFDGQAGTSEDESLALFGLPLSPPQQEILEGQSYTVQWFERARFELHPQNAPPYNVLLGLLGRETLEAR